MFGTSPLNSGAALLGYNSATIQESLKPWLEVPALLPCTEFATGRGEAGLKETLQLLAAALDAPAYLDRNQGRRLQALVKFAQGFCSPKAPGCVRNYERPFVVDPGSGAPLVLHQLRIQHIMDSNEHLVLVSFTPLAVFPQPQTHVTSCAIKCLPIERDSLFVGVDSRSYILGHDASVTIPHHLLNQYDVNLCAPDERYCSPGFLITANNKIVSRWFTMLPKIEADGSSQNCSLNHKDLRTVSLAASVRDRRDGPQKIYRATIQGFEQASERCFAITNHGPAHCFVVFRPKQLISSEESARIRGTPQEQFNY
jgi:hypothetical protein